MKFEIKRLNQYSKESVIEEIQRIWKLLNEKPFTYAEFRNAGGKIMDTTVRNYFGSWNQGLIKAGIQIHRKMHIDDEELMEEFHKVVEKLKRKPTCNEFKQKSKYSINVYVKRYGSFLRACQRYLDWLSPEQSKIDITLPKVTNDRKRTQRGLLTKSKRFDVFLRDNFTCKYCGKHPPQIKLEADHIKPASLGGSNDMTNLVTSCYECNRGKRNKEIPNK